MEFIIELILELIFEGGEEICANKKISKWIRYPISFIMISIFAIVIFGIILLGMSLIKTNTIVAVMFIGIGLVMLIGVIFKFKNVYKENYKNKTND